MLMRNWGRSLSYKMRATNNVPFKIYFRFRDPKSIPNRIISKQNGILKIYKECLCSIFYIIHIYLLCSMFILLINNFVLKIFIQYISSFHWREFILICIKSTKLKDYLIFLFDCTRGLDLLLVFCSYLGKVG